MARIASMDGGCANSLQIHPVHDLLQFSILRVFQIRIFYGPTFKPHTSKKCRFTFDYKTIKKHYVNGYTLLKSTVYLIMCDLIALIFLVHVCKKRYMSVFTVNVH